jgi:hypothetical protein
MNRLWVLLLLMVAACAYGSPSPARLQQASSAAQALNEAVRESAGCKQPGRGLRHLPRGSGQPERNAVWWRLGSSSPSRVPHSARTTTYPPPVYYHNYGGYNPRYWGHLSPLMRISRGVLVMKRLMVLALLAVTLPGVRSRAFRERHPGRCRGHDARTTINRSHAVLPGRSHGAIPRWFLQPLESHASQSSFGDLRRSTIWT